MEESKFISVGEALLGEPPPIVTPPTTPPATPPAAATPPETPPTPPPTSPVLDPITQTFFTDMQTVDKDFALPDGFDKLGEAERYAFMKTELAKTVKPEAVDDPFINSYTQAKEQGLSSEEFIQQKTVVESIKKMPSREFLINDLTRQNGKTDKNPNGWTPEAIQAHLDGMDEVTLDLRANERKNAIYKQVDSENQEYLVQQKAQVKKISEEKNAGPIKEQVKELFTKMAALKDIGGIPHSPEDQAAFLPLFTDAVSLNPETGYPRVQQMFNDNEILYKALWLINKTEGGKGSLQSFLSTYKEEYKQGVLDKTRLAPRNEAGQFQTVNVPGKDSFV